MQALLDAAQWNLHPDHRVTFAPVGTTTDGFTSAIVRTVGNGDGGTGALGGRLSKKSSARSVTYLRAGEVAYYMIALCIFIHHHDGCVTTHLFVNVGDRIMSLADLRCVTEFTGL